MFSVETKGDTQKSIQHNRVLPPFSSITLVFALNLYKNHEHTSLKSLLRQLGTLVDLK